MEKLARGSEKNDKVCKTNHIMSAQHFPYKVHLLSNLEKLSTTLLVRKETNRSENAQPTAVS